ncbi:Crp/Fnr family transcriptional regulator [Undibacterium fentianense]|uniref:Crp/Fnr family transcriptional regulator n=1 Tax=Undibacterium fentianense TaxID=2828728 RepID=A0A941E361_9BURK|nr:Crp/Fnr family transcriptional regulator [Undibacterium fentianense]MBR7801490.1 Crp/Fnr family transcriptional regulator [Undibacterium fentianense]
MPIALHVAASIPLFKDFDEATLAKVAGLMSSRSYLSHDIVMRKGEIADSLGFLLNGKLQVVDLSEEGREIGIHFILPGAYFGELSVIDGQPRSASVISVKLSEVAFLPSNHARDLIFHHPLIAKRLMTHFAQIVRAASNQRTLLSIPNAFQRVFAQLQTFVRESKDGQVIEGLPKQHEIAIMVNTSRETVSRAIHTLMKMNVLEKKGTILIVKRPEKLKQVATVGMDEGENNKT